MPLLSVPNYGPLVQPQMFDPVGALAQQRQSRGLDVANQGNALLNQGRQLDLNKAKGLLGVAFGPDGKLTPEGAATFAKVDPIGYHDYTVKAPVDEAAAAKANFTSQYLTGMAKGLLPANPQGATQAAPQGVPQGGLTQGLTQGAPEQQAPKVPFVQPQYALPGGAPQQAAQPAQAPAQGSSQAGPVDYAGKIKALRDQVPMASIAGFDLTPQVEQAQREWWNSIQPKMQAIQDKYTAMGQTASPTEWAGKVYNPMMNEVNRAIPPELRALPEVKAFLASDNFKQPPQPNMTTIMNQPVDKGVISDLGARLGRGEIDVQSAFSLVNSMRTSAQNKAGLIDNLFNAAVEANPQFNAAQAKIQFKQAENVTNQSQIAAANNVLTNIDNLVKLSDATSKTGIQGFNQGLQNAQYYMGDKDLTDFRVTQMAVAEELSRVFGGNVPSDFKIKYGDKMVDGTLPYENFRSAMDQVKKLVTNFKKTKTSTMGAFAPKDNPGAGSGTADIKNDPTFGSFDGAAGLENGKGFWVNGQHYTKQAK